MTSKSLPIISFFCGAGGLDLGFRKEGYDIVLACDKERAAIESYNLNCKSKSGAITDLAKITAKQLTRMLRLHCPGSMPVGVIGGPPCQGFSRANSNADSNDPRNLLPIKYAEIIRQLNQRFRLHFFVFENVMGLTTPRHLSRFLGILESFKDAGFKVFHNELNAVSFGVAQNRRRLFIVGLNTQLYGDTTFAFPRGRSAKKCVRDAIWGLPEPTYYSRELRQTEIPYHPNHWTMMPKSAKLVTGSTGGRSFRRLKWDEESPTVAYGNREIHVHPDGGRRLSVHEAMLLQGFPKSYRLAGNLSEQVTQVSNAVPPPLAQAIARAIRRVIVSKD
jgi:DNA (cytosine-5)-methyltransferase 1